jgi:hypothetical protein
MLRALCCVWDLVSWVVYKMLVMKMFEITYLRIEKRRKREEHSLCVNILWGIKMFPSSWRGVTDLLVPFFMFAHVIRPRSLYLQSHIV